MNQTNGAIKGEHVGWKIVVHDGDKPTEIVSFSERIASSILLHFASLVVDHYLFVRFPGDKFESVPWNGFKLFEGDNSIWKIPCTRCGHKMYILCEPDTNGHFVCSTCAGVNEEEVIVIS